MIIEHQADDHILYTEATLDDWWRVVENAHILRTHKGDVLERRYTEEGQELYCITMDANGFCELLIAEINEIDHEMTVYF